MARSLAARQLDHGRFIAEASQVTFEFTIESFNVEETSVDDALSKLEDAIIQTLTQLLGSDSSVQFLNIVSKKVGTCSWSSSSDSCAEFESTISLTASTGTEDLVGRASLAEVQQFVDEFNSDSENSNIAVTFLGPFIVSANIIVRLQNTDRIMNDSEIAVFESTFLEVIVPLDDNVSLTSAKVFFQEEHIEDRRRLSQTLSTDVSVRVDGKCRACSSGEFGLLVNDAVGASSSDFEQELQNNDDGDYFDDVVVTDVTQESQTPSLATSSTAAEAATPNKFPYAVLYALAGGVAVVLGGVFYIANRNRKARLLEDAYIKEEQLRMRDSGNGTESY